MGTHFGNTGGLAGKRAGRGPAGPGRAEIQRSERSEERRVGKACRYWRDWSSDVCSSDLRGTEPPRIDAQSCGHWYPSGGDRQLSSDPQSWRLSRLWGLTLETLEGWQGRGLVGDQRGPGGLKYSGAKDRKSVVWGKRVDIGVTGVQTCALPI